MVPLLPHCIGLLTRTPKEEPMPEREIVITEADLQRIFQAFRRSLQPLTLDELVELLRNR
jgi:hypothetical protein